MEIDKVFENNKEWVNAHLELDNDYFKNLSKGQSPSILYIGCSDSRVPAESLMGAEPGEVFVTRNVANVVSNLDMSSTSVINYAVSHLKVSNLVVCGHYFCGGVAAAMGSNNMEILNPWLSSIRDVARLHKNELDSISDDNERYKRLVELNVQEQCVNAVKLPDVQKAYREGSLKIHGWVFDIHSGLLIDLKLDMKKILGDIHSTYHLE